MTEPEKPAEDAAVEVVQDAEDRGLVVSGLSGIEIVTIDVDLIGNFQIDRVVSGEAVADRDEER